MCIMPPTSVLLLLLSPAVQAAYNCSGRPTTVGDLMRTWSQVDKSTRPGIAARWAGLPTAASDGDLPPVAPPDDVFMSLQVNKLVAVDPKEQHFQVEAWWRIIWWDSRLAYDDTCVQIDSFGGIGQPTRNVESFLWMPDLYSPQDANEEPDVFNNAVWIFPGMRLGLEPSTSRRSPELLALYVVTDGKVWWLRKLFWTLECALNFEFIPFDSHHCEVSTPPLEPPPR